MGKFTFRKEERLSKEKHIQELFARGSSFYLFPFKVMFLPQADPAGPVHQVLISVSKRHFKRAVDRNLIKRRIREAYRLQQQLMPAAPRLAVAFIYTHKEPLLSAELQGKMRNTLVKLGKMALSPS
ncbi:ribonuclease P protein component [Dawidia soli]|uniref:Ribonuclease P protein component n=1 Tax=Dawidia soli TaxID=2782352 RepID=A0AAP2GFJ2_9BACT|nr:ribonuclease P protein component [Dawidia soli]MBT1689572.1 ribonuclease P protein component [Dawidia soli]